jgi:hypothetical protein
MRVFVILPGPRSGGRPGLTMNMQVLLAIVVIFVMIGLLMYFSDKG